jgi:hypothetical protein
LANFQPYFSRGPAARPGGTRAPGLADWTVF